MEHERLCHHRVYRCFDKRHKSPIWKSGEELQDHFLGYHPDLTDQQQQTLLELSETTVDDTRKVCPFCNSNGPFTDGFHNHMALHQETLATFAAPRNLHDGELCGSNDTQGTNSVISLASTLSCGFASEISWMWAVD